MVFTAFRKEVLHHLSGASITISTSWGSDVFNMEEMFVETDVAGAKLKEERGLSMWKTGDKLQPSFRWCGFVNCLCLAILGWCLPSMLPSFQDVIFEGLLGHT